MRVISMEEEEQQIRQNKTEKKMSKQNTLIRLL